MEAGGAGARIQFGISVVPLIERLDRNRELVRAADEAGLAFVGIQDHPYQRHFFDTWSLIPTLLGETKRVSFFTDVANLPLRPPAVMAKAAASLDVLSGGRFELGLGAGGIPDAIARSAQSRRDARRQRADRRFGREGGPRPGVDPAPPQPAGPDRRGAGAGALGAAGGIPGRRTAGRTGRLVGRDPRGLRGRRLR